MSPSDLLSDDNKHLEAAYRQLQISSPADMAAFIRLLDSAIDSEENTIMATMRSRMTGGTSTVTDGTKSATVAFGDETKRLQEYTEAIPGSLTQLVAADLAKLIWEGEEPFNLALWTQYPGSVAFFRSEEMDSYVDQALTHVVKGVKVGGRSITQGDLLKRIREKTGVQAW